MCKCSRRRYTSSANRTCRLIRSQIRRISLQKGAHNGLGIFCEGAIGPRALVAEDGTLDEQIKTDALPGTTLRPGEAIDSGLQRVADADAVTNWIA